LYQEGRIPLHYAALQDNVDMGKLLLAAGSDINAVDLQGNSPLHNSCYHNSIKFTALLIGAGAHLDVRSRNLETPLDYASEAGHLEIVKLLVDAKANVNLSGENNWTPLHNAACISRKIAIDVVKVLLDAGANPAALSGNGQYPCDVAVNPNVKALLVEAKAHVHITESLLKEPGILSSKDSVSTFV
jgi:ankyrin repeat protein